MTLDLSGNVNNNTAVVGQLTGVTFGTYDSDAFQYDPNTGRMTPGAPGLAVVETWERCKRWRVRVSALEVLGH